MVMSARIPFHYYFFKIIFYFNRETVLPFSTPVPAGNEKYTNKGVPQLSAPDFLEILEL